MAFSLAGIPSPNSFFAGHKKVEKYVDKIEEVCGFPLVIKDVRGSRGAHTVKVETPAELSEVMEALPKHKRYLFQQYIANEYDWGIMVANGVVVSGERRYHCVGEFRNNVCKGGTEVFIDPMEIPEKLKALAIKASEVLGLTWSRTDIIIDEKTQRPYVLEVNRLPGITSKTSEVEGAFAFLSSQVALLER